jgi:transposase
MAWLDKFNGYLQADAYGGYGIYTTGVTEVACWAHARRKFFDAKEPDGRRAAEMLFMVAKLYAVEDEAKMKISDLLKQNPDTPIDYRHEIIRALRQEKSQPILAEIRNWLDREKDVVLAARWRRRSATRSARTTGRTGRRRPPPPRRVRLGSRCRSP